MGSTPERDAFDPLAQGKFIKTLSSNMTKDAKDSTFGSTDDIFKPDKIFDALEESLRESYADETYLAEVRKLKTDPDIVKALKQFEDSLDGKADITKIKNISDTTELPQGPDAEAPAPDAAPDSGPTIDVGLNNMVFTGEVDAKGVNDLQRFSNYLSGSGSTFGGVVADLPSTLVGLSKSSVGLSMHRYLDLQDTIGELELDLDEVLGKIEVERKLFYEFTGKTPFKAKMEIAANPAKRSSVLNSALEDVNTAQRQRRNLVVETKIKTAKMEDLGLKMKSRIKARKILQKVAGGVKGAGAAASGALGGVDIAAGDDVIDNAHSLYNDGAINKDTYNKMLQDGRFRIAQGAFGIGEGINAVRELVTTKLVKNASKLAGSAKMAYRFGSVVGGAIAIGAGITSIAKNAMAARDAEESGNIGKAAVYGIMAGLDCVSVILDVVSVALDFIPGIGTAISFVLDIVNTIVNIVGMILGFFADMIDTRTPAEKLQGALDEYVESPAFTSFMDKQANFFQSQGYDVFQYIIDAKAAELSEEGADATKVDKTISRKLSASARVDFDDQNLRLALIDGSTIGRELRGRCGDDFIRAGVGDDTVYGGKGDDLLYGEKDNDTMYGGPGNDFLHAGTGRDKLFGESGDDTLAFCPGATATVDGGTGIDTASILPSFTQWLTNGIGGSGNVPNGIKSCYVDISRTEGKAGLTLGSLVYGASNVLDHVHYPAFDSASSAALKSELAEKFSGSGQANMALDSLSHKYLWYLADVSETRRKIKIFSDGTCLYAVGTMNGATGTWKESSFIPSIRESDVISIDTSTNAASVRNDKELEAWFYLAFKGTSVKGIERITVGNNNEISCQVLGSNGDNIIDVGNGGDSIVYTGSGNNVVSFKGNPISKLKASRFIVGGPGQNTLIINTGQAQEQVSGQNYVLLEPGTDLSTADKTQSPALWNGNKVEGGVFVGGMKTIQCNIYRYETRIDASNQTGPLTFVANATTKFNLIGSKGDNSFYLNHVGRGCGSEIRGFEGKNYLSLENFNLPQVLGIDLEEERTIYVLNPTPSVRRDGEPVDRRMYGEVCVKVKDILSIRGNHRTLEMKGHWNMGNLFVANGGACEIETRGGPNSVICKRGHHSVIGGTGTDSLIIYGPRVSEQIIVSVVRVATPGLSSEPLASGIKATTPIYGTWNWNNAELNLNFDYDIPAGIEVTNIQIVDAQGNQLTNKGTVELLSGNRYARFKPQSDFNGLKLNESETIRIKFDTKGSHVSMLESGPGNRIEFKNFQNSQVRAQVNSITNALEFWSTGNELIVIDRAWTRNFNRGLTSIADLCFDFAERFPELKFSNIEVQGKDVFSFLWSHLKHLVKQMNSFDNLIDARTLSSPVELGAGNDVLFARRKKMTYITGDGDDIIDISTFDAPSDGTGTETKVVTGRGDDLVVVGMNAETVKIQFAAEGDSAASGTKTLLLKDIDVNSFPVSHSSSGYEFGGESWRNVPPFLSFDVAPHLIVFDRTSSTGETIVIKHVDEYLQKRRENSDYRYRMVFTADDEMYLNIPYAYYLDEISLEINVEEELPEITLKNQYNVYYTFKLDVPFHKVISARTVAAAVWQQCRAGIKLRRSTVKDEELREGIIEAFSSSNRYRYPPAYTVVGAEIQAVVVDKSNERFTYAMNKKYVQIEPNAKNVDIEGDLSLLYLPGRTGASISVSSVSSHKEFRIGTELVCTLTALPWMCVFQADDAADYELVLDSSTLGSGYVPRWFATPGEVVYLDLSQFRSTDVSVAVTASPIYGSYVFSPARLMHNSMEVANIPVNSGHGWTNSPDRYMQNDAQSQGMEYCSQIPGGIKYSDKVLRGGELTRFFAIAVKSQVFGGASYNKTLQDDDRATLAFLKTARKSVVFTNLRKLARCVDIAP